MATFLVRSKLRLATDPGVFLVGEVTNGMIRTGMTLLLGVERGIEGATVDAVELVDHPGGRAEVALRIACKSPDDERLIEALCADGDTVEVVERTASTARACDECGSAFFAGSSAMTALCAECAHRLYGYPACEHQTMRVDESGVAKCHRCGWDGSTSKYLRGDR